MWTSCALCKSVPVHINLYLHCIVPAFKNSWCCLPIRYILTLSIFMSLVPRPLLFAFTTIHGNRRLAKMGKAWEHSSHGWTWGGRVGGEGEKPIFKYVRNKLESKFLTSQDEYSFDHANVWSPKLRWSARMDDPMHCFGSWAPPPYVHLVSTWHHSCDECSQAFPVLHQPCIIVNENGRGLGMKLWYNNA